MHPVLLQLLAAERASYMITKADDWRSAHQASLARRPRSSRQKARSGLPRRPAELEPPSANAAALPIRAIGIPGPSADGGQGCELVLGRAQEQEGAMRLPAAGRDTAPR
jgi:hypothetical protein